MDVALNQPLSEAELDELTDFLDSDLVPDDSMDVCMLHGYLTAIAIGPVTLLPSQWFPLIWGQVDEPAFDSLEHAQHILDLIVRYYNQIVRTFMEAPEKFLPSLYEYVEEGERTLSAEEWCIGFSLGVHLRIEAWEPLLEDEEVSGMLAPIVAFSMDDAWNEVTAGRNPVEVRQKLIALLPSAVRAIHAYWLPLREKRPPGLTADSFHLGGSSKAPSNAPCPCGSGKKFKKCCGAAVKM
ncbi:MAG: UPF0149 family protein [Terriglobia bacterium]|jgi:uncharacterized protein